MQDVCHLVAEVAPDVVDGCGSALDDGVEQHAEYAASRQARLFGHDEGCLQVLNDGVDAEGVALKHSFLGCFDEICSEFLFVAILYHVGGEVKDLALNGFYAFALFVGKELSCVHFLIHY